jgi:hypothetical protein
MNTIISFFSLLQIFKPRTFETASEHSTNSATFGPNNSYCEAAFFMAGPVCCLPVTLDYRIDFYIQGSNYNIFAIKTTLTGRNFGDC